MLFTDVVYDAISLSDLKPHRNTSVASTPIMTKPSKIPMLLKFPANRVRVALTAYENGLILAMSWSQIGASASGRIIPDSKETGSVIVFNVGARASSIL